MSETYLDWIKDLVDSVVNANDLNVIQGTDEPLDLSVGFQRIEQGSVAVWRQFEWALRVKQDFSILVDSR